jgi:hypothetical protein
MFKKLFKGIKKVFKKVGKGIKKVVKGVGKVLGKVAKPFQKFGLVGQIALGFIMPWAIGSVFGGLTSTAFGTFAQGLTQSGNLFAKAAGYAFKGIHWGATQVSNAYSFISDKISSGIEGLSNKAKSLFGKKADASNLIDDALINAPEFKESYIDDLLTKPTFDEKGFNVGKLSQMAGEKAVSSAPTTFTGKIGEAALSGAISGVSSGVEDFVYQGIAGEEGQGGSWGGIVDFTDPSLQYGKANETDLLLQNSGLHYGTPSYALNTIYSSFGQSENFNWFNKEPVAG